MVDNKHNLHLLDNRELRWVDELGISMDLMNGPDPSCQPTCRPNPSIQFSPVIHTQLGMRQQCQPARQLSSVAV